jgi:hypothetical protein
MSHGNTRNIVGSGRDTSSATDKTRKAVRKAGPMFTGTVESDLRAIQPNEKLVEQAARKAQRGSGQK